MQYLHVRNWSKFQHYKKRNPPWIKLHYEILSSHDWIIWNDASKLLAIACMMLASKNFGCIPHNENYIKKASNIDNVDFKPLLDNGFLESYSQEQYEELIDASAMLADASTKTETEAETNKYSEPKTETGVNGFLHASGFGKFSPTLETAQKLRDIAPGWDQHSLIDKYNSWTDGKDRPRHDQAAFIGWAKKYTGGRRPN